jgi:hypothetical protein
MRVYRFERNGYGPYTCESPETVRDKRLNAQLDVHEDNYDGTWPIAIMDGIPLSMAIACPSVKQLTTWFDGMVGSLVRCGFRIRVYDVDDENVVPGYSEKQLGFYHSEIRKVIR